MLKFSQSGLDRWGFRGANRGHVATLPRSEPTIAASTERPDRGAAAVSSRQASKDCNEGAFGNALSQRAWSDRRRRFCRSPPRHGIGASVQRPNRRSDHRPRRRRRPERQRLGSQQPHRRLRFGYHERNRLLLVPLSSRQQLFAVGGSARLPQGAGGEHRAQRGGHHPAGRPARSGLRFGKRDRRGQRHPRQHVRRPSRPQRHPPRHRHPAAIGAKPHGAGAVHARRLHQSRRQFVLPRQRNPAGLEQHPPGRHRRQRRRRATPRAVPHRLQRRLHRGVPRHHQRRQGRIRAQRWRPGRDDHPLRHQPVARQCLRVPPQYQAQRQQLLQQCQRRRPPQVHPEHLWRIHRRPHPQGEVVYLRQLADRPHGAGSGSQPDRAHQRGQAGHLPLGASRRRFGPVLQHRRQRSPRPRLRSRHQEADRHAPGAQQHRRRRRAEHRRLPLQQPRRLRHPPVHDPFRLQPDFDPPRLLPP